MSRLQRHTSTIWYSVSRNHLWILLFALCMTQCEPLSHSYLRAQTGVNNGLTQFESNLKHLFSDLVRYTPTTGYNVSSYGESPNEVAGYLQCRGDASQAQCSDCCQSITKNSTSESGILDSHTWNEMCELYYVNYSNPLVTDDEDASFQTSCNGSIKIRDPVGLQNLLSKLSVQASTASTKFAKGSSVDSSGQKIYGLVQCNRDLPTSNCSDCLSQAFLQIDVLHVGFGSYIYMGSCYFIIANEPTYSYKACTGSTANHSRKLPKNLGIVGSAFVVMALLLL